MKKCFLITGSILALMLMLPNFAKAQAAKAAAHSEEVKSGSERRGEETVVRNTKVYDANPVIDGVELDKRIAKYYSEADMNDLAAKKVKQLNFLYLKSFEVLNVGDLSADCKKYINEKFDIGEYEKYRKQNEKWEVQIKKDGFSFKVALLAKSELTTLLTAIN